MQPLDKTCRELNRKYVMPLGYALNNLLITNWDNQNYTELDFYDLYEKMYYMKYGKQVPYEANYGGVEYEVPEDEFEEVIKTYLPLVIPRLKRELFITLIIKLLDTDREGYMIVNSHMSHIRKLSHMKNYKMEH